MATMKATPAFVLELDKFGEQVVKEVHKSLKARGYSISVVTGRLYKSVRYTLNKRKKKVSFYYIDYGQYLDESPKYHSRVKGKKGTKTLGWFSDPFNKVLQKFPTLLEDAIVEDIERQIDSLSQK